MLCGVISFLRSKASRRSFAAPQPERDFLAYTLRVKPIVEENFSENGFAEAEDKYKELRFC